ncbi:M24 family metallopeptidase [Haloterrigena sp. SYSU A121-1]|uniref:M24 family metallopeptidase n=1 Tax=Haloterrigena gelatinilytica TaxID=2741724 RepID=A0A8J8GRW4_9EURY|nr:M24 family metallopeptidase [Haloterrigena gelatinilytica]NUB93397.1 M24 family metallopeptidase [Haloterrigena gelatinilytica]
MTAVRDQKLTRLDEFMTERELSELWFLRPANFAWLTGGGNSTVDRAADVGVAALGYDGDAVRALTPNNEADRFREEELPSGVPVETFDWHESSLGEAVARESADGAGADVPTVPGLESIDASRLRLPVTDRDRQVLERAGRATADAVETVAREVSPDDTERAAAGRLRDELWDRGLESPVVLVGGAERSQRHRHFTPTDEPLGDYALLTVVAVERGVNIAVTRTVDFDAPSWLRERHDDASRVAATAMAATRDAAAADDGTAGDVFAEIERAYAAVGWEGEWQHHHQGGSIGFESREWIATPSHDAPVETPAPYAWNPTVQGAKTEDTVLISPTDVDVVTDTGSWPTAEYAAVDDELRLELPTPLSR